MDVIDRPYRPSSWARAITPIAWNGSTAAMRAAMRAFISSLIRANRPDRHFHFDDLQRAVVGGQSDVGGIPAVGDGDAIAARLFLRGVERYQRPPTNASNQACKSIGSSSWR